MTTPGTTPLSTPPAGAEPTPEQRHLIERFGCTFQAGAEIFAEGALADACYLLHEGRVRILKDVRGAPRSLSVLRAGDLFGEDALLPRARRSASAVALVDVQALRLERDAFDSLMQSDPAITQNVLAQLVRRLRDAEEQLENAMLRDHPSRVVNTLLRMSASAEVAAEGHVLHISPLELSSRVGLDVEAVKRTIQQLRDGAYLQIVNERIVLPDLEALAQLYQLLGVKEEVRGGPA
ncbi:MAG: Crp/Fnr family transcriptional regulator [Polyangiales bacterium]|nr:Crp/Fnr family transcriptional regulator [Myxococcales bacterium]MCB9661617.1 Crp/Fnr family transcriptional regulator [Sandaracinaceae bacterium]